MNTPLIKGQRCNEDGCECKVESEPDKYPPRIDIIDRSGVAAVYLNGELLNGHRLMSAEALRADLRSYIEEAHEQRDAAADEGDYEAAIRWRTRAEVLEEVVGTLGNA